MASSATARTGFADPAGRDEEPGGRVADGAFGGATVVPTGADPEEPGNCIGWASKADGMPSSTTSNAERKDVMARVSMRQSKFSFDLRIRSQRLFWTVPSIRKLNEGPFHAREGVTKACSVRDVHRTHTGTFMAKGMTGRPPAHSPHEESTAIICIFRCCLFADCLALRKSSPHMPITARWALGRNDLKAAKACLSPPWTSRRITANHQAGCFGSSRDHASEGIIPWVKS